MKKDFAYYEEQVLTTDENSNIFWVGWMIALALLAIAHAIKETKENI